MLTYSVILTPGRWWQGGQKFRVILLHTRAGLKMLPLETKQNKHSFEYFTKPNNALVCGKLFWNVSLFKTISKKWRFFFFFWVVALFFPEVLEVESRTSYIAGKWAASAFWVTQVNFFRSAISFCLFVLIFIFWGKVLQYSRSYVVQVGFKFTVLQWVSRVLCLQKFPDD